GAAKDLPADSFPATAQMFGLGTKEQIGVDAFGGSVPQPTSPNEQAATSIGQAKGEVSPLAMASVAGAGGAGTWHAPGLVSGARPPGRPGGRVAPRAEGGGGRRRGPRGGAGPPAGTVGKAGPRGVRQRQPAADARLVRRLPRRPRVRGARPRRWRRRRGRRAP